MDVSPYPPALQMLAGVTADLSEIEGIMAHFATQVPREKHYEIMKLCFELRTDILVRLS